MHKVKFFIGQEDDLSRLESEVNAFLASGVKVVSLVGNIAPQTPAPRAENKTVSSEVGARRFAPSDVFVAIVYST